MKVVGYGRCSTPEQASNGLNTEVQRRSVERVAEARLEDDVGSGRTQRPRSSPRPTKMYVRRCHGPGAHRGQAGDPLNVFTHLMEGIGIALDLTGDRTFIIDFGGGVLSAELNGSDKKVVLVAQENLTGIAYSELS
jgi:hypothetical protein